MKTTRFVLAVLVLTASALASPPAEERVRTEAKRETTPVAAAPQSAAGRVQNMGGDRVDIVLPGGDPASSTSNDPAHDALPDLDIPYDDPGDIDSFRPLTAAEVSELLAVDDEPADELPPGDALDPPGEDPSGDVAPATASGMRRVEPEPTTFPSSPPEVRSPEPAPASGLRGGSRGAPASASDSDSILVYLEDDSGGFYVVFPPARDPLAPFDEPSLEDNPFAGLDELLASDPDPDPDSDAPSSWVPEEDPPPTAEELGLGAKSAGIQIFTVPRRNGRGEYVDETPVDTVLLGQPFVVQALIPADEDPGTGSVVATVTTPDGEEAVITLYWDGRAAEGGFFTYRSRHESLSGDSYGLVVGGTVEGLDLELDDEHTNSALQVGYGGRSGSVYVFGDRLGAEIALVEETLDLVGSVLQGEQIALDTIRESAAVGPGSPIADELTAWEAAIARRRSVLVLAYEALANYERPIDKLRYTRHFLSALLTPGEHGTEVVEDVIVREVLLGVSGVTEGIERTLVRDYGEVLEGYLFGVYSTFTHVTLAAPVYTLVTGDDEFGRPGDRRWAAVEVGAALVLIKLPGAIVEWGAGGFAPTRLGSLSVPGFRGGSAGVGAGGGARVTGGAGRLAAETAGGRLAYPGTRPVRGLKPTNIQTIRGTASASGYSRAQTDEYLTRLDEVVVQARRQGVPDELIDGVIRGATNEAGLHDASLVIEQQLLVEGALRSGKVLVAPGDVAVFGEWATPEQVARAFQFDHEIVSTVVAKAYLHQRTPQTFTAEELRIVKGIIENRDTVLSWRRVVVEEAGYDGLSPIVTQGDLNVLLTTRWRPVVDQTLAGPSGPRLGAAEPAFDPTTSLDSVGPPPIVVPRGGSTLDPIGTWDEVRYVDPLGRPTTLAEVLPLLEQVNPGFASASGARSNCQFCTDEVWRILRGEGAQVAERGFGGDIWIRQGEGATAAHPIELPTARDWHVFDSFEPIVDLFGALPPLSHGRVAAFRAAQPGQNRSGHIFNIWKDIDGKVYFLDGQVGRPIVPGPEFVEYKLLLTDFLGTPANVTAVPAPRAVVSGGTGTGSGSASSGPGLTGARRPSELDPNAETILEAGRPRADSGSRGGSGTGTDLGRGGGTGTEAFSPNATSAAAARVERLFDHRLVQKALREAELRDAARMAGRAPRGGFTHWTQSELARLRELDADPTRYVGLLPELRGAARRAVRDAVAHRDAPPTAPAFGTVTDDLVVVKAGFEAEGRAQRWSPDEIQRLDALAEDPALFEGLVRSALTPAEVQAVQRAASMRRARDVPPASGESTRTSRADLPVLDPVADPDALGGPSGRGGAVEVVIKSTGGSTGPVLEMFVVNSGKPLRIAGEGIVLEPIAEEDLDAAARERLAAIEASASGGGPLAPGVGDGGWQFERLEVVKVELDAYCLQRARDVPTEGQLFRIADAAAQAAGAPMRSILLASRRLHEAGALSPDSEPTEYYHSIRQWAIWTDEQSLDRDGYQEAFVAHVRKNVEASGQTWSDAFATAVENLVPNRWNDIQRVLNEAR